MPHVVAEADDDRDGAARAAMNSDAIEKPGDRGTRRDRERERGEDAGHDEREAHADHDVGRDREPHHRRPTRTRSWRH